MSYLNPTINKCIRSRNLPTAIYENELFAPLLHGLK